METSLKSAALKNLIVHYVGNKNNLDPVHIATEALDLSTELLQTIGESFLTKFSTLPEAYHFHHPASLQYNEIYNYTKELFHNREAFVTISSHIAKHLYESSVHPKVKGGELYIGYFENLPVESRMCKAIGLFKTENKTLFLDTQHTNNIFSLQVMEGVELTKLDKGCLIINTKEEEGYEVLLFDNQNKGEEAQYWKEKFLNAVPQKNEYHQTAQFLTLTKQYITNQLEDEFKTSKKDRIDLLNKSIDYFKTKEAFEVSEFQNEIFGNEEMIQSFRQFGSRYTEQNGVDIGASFDISADAVKKQSRIFKSVVKLDKNFHIYIHGRTDLIEKGMDLDGRKYYKIYYQDEA